ncbi:MAG: transaldolase [Gemmatimonadaceae bacterium]|nr:transaldolase [Gemmatimonadaceae bacterium]
MTRDRLKELHEAGQSIWLDNIDRTMLHNGDLENRIRNECLTGMTSNPTIFEKALAQGSAYDEQLGAAESGLSTSELFELVETEDVRRACDLFAGVFTKSRGNDGYVSIEVSPGVASDPNATIEEARRLWKTVDRPNLMVKVPGTPEGAAAVRTLIADGINVNITLLFAIEAHDRVVDAYMSGLEDRVKAGKPVDGIASVASFFVSRVDTEVDKRLDALIQKAPGESELLNGLKGRAAIANAKLAYQLFVERFSSPRWRSLEAAGARVQRPLWASTSTKNPAYRDVIYAEELIGTQTVNTMPPGLIEAFRDHGETAVTVDRDPEESVRTIRQLEGVGVSMKDVTDKLLVDGLASFQKSFDTLLAGIGSKISQLKTAAR